MKNITLNNGIPMPALGLGVFQISDLRECERCVSAALETGYRLIDTASSYKNEGAVGKAIKNSAVPREEIFVTSKLWIQDAGYEKTKKAFEKTLDNLKLDYLDLYLIHQPLGDVYGSWRAMEELYHQKKIRAIGVSNFPQDRLMDLTLFNEVPPAVNQVEVHPLYQRYDDQRFLAENGIRMEALSPFAQGKNKLLESGVLRSIGQKYGKNPGQVILRWFIQRGIVAIPKSAHIERIKANFDVFDFEIDADDMAAIKSLDEDKSIFGNARDPETIKWLAAYKG